MFNILASLPRLLFWVGVHQKRLGRKTRTAIGHTCLSKVMNHYEAAVPTHLRCFYLSEHPTSLLSLLFPFLNVCWSLLLEAVMLLPYCLVCSRFWSYSAIVNRCTSTVLLKKLNENIKKTWSFQFNNCSTKYKWDHWATKLLTDIICVYVNLNVFCKEGPECCICIA